MAHILDSFSAAKKKTLSISLSQWKENFDGSYQDLSTKGLKHTMSKNPNHASRRGQA